MGPIPIENELKAFKEHLDINERTIFCQIWRWENILFK